MPEYTVVEKKTGRIVRTCDVPAADRDLQLVEWEPGNPPRRVRRKGLMIVDGRHEGRTHYWKDGAIVERPAILDRAEVQLAVEESHRIGNVPKGTEVTVTIGGDVATHTVDDGEIEIASRQPVDVHLVIRPPFPWRRQELKVMVK